MLRFSKDIIAELEKAGWPERRILSEKMLSETTLAKIKINDTCMNLRTVDRICEMLDKQPGEFLEYYDPIAKYRRNKTV